MSETATSSDTVKKTSSRAVHAVHGDNHKPGPFGFFNCKYCKAHRPKMAHNQTFCDKSCKDAYHRSYKNITKIVLDLQGQVESLEQRVKELESR